MNGNIEAKLEDLSNAPLKEYRRLFLGLDLALEALYLQTDFHKMGRKFYYRTIKGTLKLKHQEKLRELGVKL